MTYTEIKATDKEFLTPDDVAGCIGCQAYSITAQAKENPARLGFPTNIIGTRVRIPRRAFLHWMQYGNAPVLIDKTTE